MWQTLDCLASGPLAGGEQMVGLSHLRFAAGVCVLAAGLLMGGAGGAVAVADPDSSGSAAHGDDGTNASGQHGNGNDASGQPSTGAKSPVTAWRHRRFRPARQRQWRQRFGPARQRQWRHRRVRPAFHRREKPE